QVENSMGQLSKQVKTSTRVPEQALNKAAMYVSLITLIASNYDKHSEEFKDKLRNRYYPSLFRDQDAGHKLTGTSDYALNELEKSLLQPILNAPAPDTCTKIDKVSIGNFVISPSLFSNTHNT